MYFIPGTYRDRPIEPRKPLMRQMAQSGLEFDQKLRHAFELAASKPDIQPEDDGLPDSYVTLALYRTNTVLSRMVDLQQRRLNLFHDYKLAPPCPLDDVVPGQRLAGVLNEAVSELAGAKVIGVGHFLRAIVRLTLDQSAHDVGYLGFPGQVVHNTFSAETLLWGLGHTAWTPVSKAPELKVILENLDRRHPIDDHEYLMTREGGRLVFRPTSVLDPFDVARKEGQPARRLAVLPHFAQNYGGFQPSDILAFEDLINSKKSREVDLQKFLERHPAFLRLWDFRDVYPQVVLTREQDGELIPDFLLVDPALQQATIVDLKLPMKKVAVGAKDRRHFSQAVEEAIAQLRMYQAWFDDPHNRSNLKERFGLEIYRPRLAVVIGRSSSFADEMDRQRLVASTPDVQVVTYDDISERAKRRLVLVAGAERKVQDEEQP
jgi:hypothetical protein